MIRTSIIFLAVALSTINAYAPISLLNKKQQSFVVGRGRHSIGDISVRESFGFDFAEDQEENTPDVILGEESYKQWINSVDDNAFLNRQYNAVRRVRELDLLKLTAELGILSKLEKNGIDLETIESVLPAAQELGILNIVGQNQQLLINLVAPLLIEPAPLLLPVVAGALDVGPIAFFGAAAVTASTELFLVSNDVELPLVGLPAGIVGGLLLLPLTIILGGLGVVLTNTNKNQ